MMARVLRGDLRLDLRDVEVVGAGSMSTNTGVAPRRAIAPAVAKNVYGVVMTSSPGPMSSAIRHASSASLPDDTPIAVRAAAVPRDRLLALLHLRAEDEVLRLHHLGDRRVDLGLDGRVLRLKIEQRNIHVCASSLSCR